MRLGYVPDCFGQGGNMPQIYRQFGIRHALFWRGIADNTLHEPGFLWQGDNGDKVFAVQMPWGYHYGGLIDETPATMKAFLDEKMAPIEARSTRQHLYQRIVDGVAFGIGQGLIVNAGHGLHYHNVEAVAAIKGINELNIGHALVAPALVVGFKSAVSVMKVLILAAAAQEIGSASGRERV